MKGVWHIALRHALHNRAVTFILATCVCVTVFLPLAMGVLTRWYAQELVARADATPLVAGARGNRIDLTLASLYWRRAENTTLSMADFARIKTGQVGDDGLAVPLHVRFTARGAPIAATTPEYFAARDISVASGTLPLLLGDAVVGAGAARRLGVADGGVVFSDQIDAFDISKPPALKLRIVGVLSPTGSPDDDAVFTDIKTAWILEGLAHGHVEAATAVPDRLVLSRTGKGVALSEELIEYNEVTSANLASFHLHAEESTLPLTSVLVFPSSDKSATLIRARGAVSKEFQVVSPREVIDELLAVVGRVKAILAMFFSVLALSTLALMGLVAALSVRVRARETETLHKIGCSRWFVFQLHTVEFACIVLAGSLAACAGLGIAAWLMPSLVRLLQGAGSVG